MRKIIINITMYHGPASMSHEGLSSMQRGPSEKHSVLFSSAPIANLATISVGMKPLNVEKLDFLII